MGTIASPSASALYVSTEAAWGSTAGGNYLTGRVTNISLRSRQSNTTSEELSVAREPATLVRNDVSAEGSVSFEIDVADTVFDAYLASIMSNAWSTALAISADLDVTTVVTGTSCHWSATSGTFALVNAGDWVKSGNFVNSANNGTFYVSAKTNPGDVTVMNSAAVAETTATAVTVTGQRLVFGASTIGLSLEQKVPTTSLYYRQATGMIASSLSLNIAARQILNGQVQFTGKNVIVSHTSMAGTPTAVGTGTITNAIDNVVLYEGVMGTAETWKAAQANIQINLPVSPLSAIGTIGAVGIRLGRPTVTANVNIHVENASGPETDGIYDMENNFTAGTQRSGLGLIVSGTSSKYVFMFQQYGISDFSVDVGGNDSDFFAALQIAAAINSTTSTAFSVFKV